MPIIIVTAKDSEADKVRIELGADDYVTKPFSVRELVSRGWANLRRTAMRAVATVDDTVNGGAVEMDVARHEVRVQGEAVASHRRSSSSSRPSSGARAGCSPATS